MRAFISYSINNSEQYVVSILARKLTEQGFIVSSSYVMGNYLLQYQTFTQLNKANLFIGIITYSGKDVNRVYSEWRNALESKIPAILLIEDIVTINQELQYHPNIVRFNRTIPEKAIELVKQKIQDSSRQSSIMSQQNNDNTAAWLLGGIAALALIALLSGKK